MAQYDAEIKGRLADAIENCLTMFNTMSHVWPLDQNIKAAKDSIISEVEHLLELPEVGEEGE